MTFARYLGYRLKSSAFRNIALSLLPAVAVMYKTADENPYYPNAGEIWEYKCSCELHLPATVLFAFAVIIPILENACLKERRDLDLLYSMPIKRGGLALAHYLCGYIQLVFIYSVTFFSYWLYLGVHTDYYSLQWLALYYPCSLLAGLIIYSVIAFVFNEANTLFDGIVFSLIWVFAAYVLIRALLFNLDSHLPDKLYFSYIRTAQSFELSAPIENLNYIFRALIQTNRNPISEFKLSNYASELKCIALWGGAGIASAFGYFFGFFRKGAQKAGEISSSPFGYRLLIPLVGFSLISIYNYTDILPIFILIAMYAGYIVYRRSFKIKLADYLMLALAALIPLFKL